MLPTKIRFPWSNGFREEDVLEIDLSATWIGYGGHVVTDQNEMSELHRWSAIEAYYKVAFHFAKRFQRRMVFFQKSTNQKQELLVADMFAYESGLNEQS